MTERPKERPNGLVTDGQWLIFAKPGSYYAAISGRTLAGNVVDPHGKLAITWGSLKRHSRF